MGMVQAAIEMELLGILHCQYRRPRLIESFIVAVDVFDVDRLRADLT